MKIITFINLNLYSLLFLGGFLCVFFLFYLIRQILYIYNKKRKESLKKKVVSRSDFYDFFLMLLIVLNFSDFFEVYFLNFQVGV